MSRRRVHRSVVAGRVVAGVLAISGAGLITNVVTGRDLPGWLEWVTHGSRAWWAIGALLLLAAVVETWAELGNETSEAARGGTGAVVEGNITTLGDTYIAQDMRFDQRRMPPSNGPSEPDQKDTP